MFTFPVGDGNILNGTGDHKGWLVLLVVIFANRIPLMGVNCMELWMWMLLRR